MQVTYYKHFSYALDRDMEFKVYGHSGKVLVIFPAQNGRFFDYENFGMVDSLSRYIESGQIQLFTVDSVDEESWSLEGQDYDRRIRRQEAYYHYICDEFYPYMKKLHYETTGQDDEVFTSGCSMGATHALNFFLRRPDLFNGVIALSGVYHASYFFPNYVHPIIYQNSITDYLPNMPKDHPYLDLYRRSKIVVCVGQGTWEDESIADTLIVQKAFNDLGVEAWCDFWGYDVNHDWPWWRTQIAYFINFFLE